MKFSVGKQCFPLFAVCGEKHEVLMDGALLFVASGMRPVVELLVSNLNQAFQEVGEVGIYDGTATVCFFPSGQPPEGTKLYMEKRNA